ncbi:hypothetical protein NEMBOFW57_001575 [Staphylotrichum longicolle]|uniref:RING-type domain-containing protein n=1 Tax=Staphylotrichum longicolle TaxID=669026 RepID=A0AAD4I1T5_9PEZI|nr:hypothetical protein NEMBOFW57_001575 [Staphylotrichum longicolle]
MESSKVRGGSASGADIPHSSPLTDRDTKNAVTYELFSHNTVAARFFSVAATNTRGTSSQWKKYMGRQVECVVCLEEYVDGVSRVMSLPCGHEFHAECIDVVRSLARGTSSGPQYEPFREDGYESNDEEEPETYQDRLASPNRLDDLERGPSWNQGSRQDWQANRNDVWFSAFTSRFGGSSSFPTGREAAGEDRGR